MSRPSAETAPAAAAAAARVHATVPVVTSLHTTENTSRHVRADTRALHAEFAARGLAPAPPLAAPGACASRI